jgi:hypothetical protein
MIRFMNRFAVLALATSLTPIAAGAATMTPLSYVQSEVHKAISGPVPEVQRIADIAAPIVRSGANNQLYPESVGG